MDQLDKEFFVLAQAEKINSTVSGMTKSSQIAMGIIAGLANLTILIEKYPVLLSDDIAAAAHNALKVAVDLLSVEDLDAAAKAFEEISSFSGGLPDSE